MSFSTFQQWFEIDPITLVGGVAASFPGQLLPLSQLLQTAAFSAGLAEDKDRGDPYFAHFKPLPGASLNRNDLGRYPFANQATAANAIIVQPTNVSMVMSVPARGADGFMTKYSIMSALKQTLDQHSAKGGWYSVAVPTNLYDTAILLDLHDVTNYEFKQSQVYWQWDFEVPLITQQQATQVQSQLMAKLSSGTQVLPGADGTVSWSGLQQAPGQPNSQTTTTLLPGSGSQSVVGGASSPSSLSSLEFYGGLR